MNGEPRRPDRRLRGPAAALIAAFGAATAFTTSAYLVRDAQIPSFDARLFRWVNDLPGALGFLEIPMQLGSINLLPAVAIVTALLWRRFLPVAALVAGELLAWAAANQLKEIIERGRPPAYLTAIHLRETPHGLGYPSGHAAVAAAGACAAVAWLPARWRLLPIVLAVLVGVARIYVGVHFPLDVVGGAALGTAIGILAVGVARAADRASTQPRSPA